MVISGLPYPRYITHLCAVELMALLSGLIFVITILCFGETWSGCCYWVVFFCIGDISVFVHCDGRAVQRALLVSGGQGTGGKVGDGDTGV